MLPFGLEQCTFRPATNPVRADAMPAAALYVQAPIYERLARTQTAAQREREAAVAQDLAAAAEAQLLNQQYQAGGGGSSNNNQREEEARSNPADDRKLAEFLARQAAMVARKEHHMRQLVAQTAPVGRPTLCAKSLEIVAERRGQQQAAGNASGRCGV